MKKALILILIAMFVFVLTACSDPYEEELRQMQEAHDAISDFASDLGIVLPEFGSTSDADTTGGNTDSISGYSLLPIEALSITSSGRNNFSGNRYYAEGMIMEVGELSGNKEYVLFLPFLEENETWINFAIIADNANERFIEYMFDGESIRFSFEFVGFSNELGVAYGNFISYELYDPFS